MNIHPIAQSLSKSVFYHKFPNFDWQFYLAIYSDLQNANITTEHQAITHYWRSGQYENRRTHQIIKQDDTLYSHTDNLSYEIFNECKQGCVSTALHLFEDRFMKKYSLQPYHDTHTNCVFFGVYNDGDLQKINQHAGLRIIIWGGEDANPMHKHSLATIREIKRLHNVMHLAISTCIQNSLLSQEIPSHLIDFDLLDTSLFYPVRELGHKIFIYNGYNTGRESVYGKDAYTQVMQRLPHFEYILSNTLHVPHADMPGIYKQCFIALRLTPHDGNANMVQECAAMQIPVVHNQSEYGLKWNTVDDVIEHINRLSQL